MNSIRHKFYMHIAHSGLCENDVWTDELQDAFYNMLNAYERNEFNFLIKELIDENIILKNESLFVLTKHGQEVSKTYL